LEDGASENLAWMLSSLSPVSGCAMAASAWFEDARIFGDLIFGRLAFVPEDLAEDAHPGHRLAVGRAELLGELADDGLGGVGGEAAGVAGGVEDVEEELGETLAVFCGRWSCVEGRDLDGGFEAGAGELVEADGDGLAEVHGEVAAVLRRVHGDGGEEGGVGELVVGEAGFFGAEEESDAVLRGRRGWGCVQGLKDEGGGLLEGENGVLELALADGGGGDDEGAVGDGGGEGVVAAGGVQDVLRGYSGLGLQLGGFKRGGEVVDDAEVGEAEVLHGASRGADVGGIACADEDDGEAGASRGGEHLLIVVSSE
jgi:hypothetical protein